jgi:hypothetical protein
MEPVPTGHRHDTAQALHLCDGEGKGGREGGLVPWLTMRHVTQVRQQQHDIV